MFRRISMLLVTLLALGLFNMGTAQARPCEGLWDCDNKIATSCSFSRANWKCR